jgi:hypothetical protein
MEKSPLNVIEIQKAFWDAVRKTINKFREHPDYFFTESDIVSYFYFCFYSSSFEIMNADKRCIYLAHREYPTNFRYDKNKLLDEAYEPYSLNGGKGSRGNYDFAILSPGFVKNAETVKHVVNKDIQLLLERKNKQPNGNPEKELLFSVEFKYIINNSKRIVDGIKKDSRKLSLSERDQSELGVNLIFCNISPYFYSDILNAVKESEVITFFICSYFDDQKKLTPKPVINTRLKDYSRTAPEMFEKAFLKSILT